MARQIRVRAAAFGDLDCIVSCRCDEGEGCHVSHWEAGPTAATFGFADPPAPSDVLRHRRFATPGEAMREALRELLLRSSRP